MIGVRNPWSVRPYQHVLDPLSVYLMIAQRQYEDSSFAGCYNVGPNIEDCITTAELVNLFCQKWGKGLAWVNKAEPNAPHEAGFLKLDCTKLKQTFDWSPRWNIERAVEMTCQFDKVYLAGGDIGVEMDREIDEFLKEP